MSEAVLTTLIIAVIGPVVLYVLKNMKPKNTISDVMAMYESIIKSMKGELARKDERIAELEARLEEEKARR